MSIQKDCIIKEFQIRKRPVDIETAVDKNSFKRLINYEFEEPCRSDIGLYLPMVCAGEKTGLTEGFSKNKWKSVSNDLKELGLSHKVKIHKDIDLATFYVSSSNKMIQNINTKDEDEIFGEFLGVPPEDNLWFDNDEMSINDKTPFLRNLDNIPKEVSENIHYARLVSWVCKPNARALKRTINIGKSYYNLAEDLMSNYGIIRTLNIADEKLIEWDHPWYS